MKNKLFILVALVAIYILFKNYIPYGNYVVYPVTFLHEFGHSFFALITGGSVRGIQINSDGSGYAITAGGWSTIILMGGYIGSAIFGNILLYMGLKKSKYSEKIIYILSGLMIFTGIFWFNSVFSSIILFLIAGLFIILAKKTDFDSYILSFLGIASLLYIIEDFNVGPSSDLAKFADIFIIVPQFIWMYLWLLIVIIITGFNLRNIFIK